MAVRDRPERPRRVGPAAAVERTALERLSLQIQPTAATVDATWLDGLDGGLASALAELPDGQRRAIELRVLADQAYDDVARELDCTPETAPVRVHRGLRSIRQRLSPTSNS